VAAPTQLPDTAWQEAVRDELGRILSHPLFRSSKRYPNLLRHIVERTLEGRASELKERTLGIEVFGRGANYDTNLDPIVRITVCEIRKRIGQYYQEAGHRGELHIELPLGSYVAEFHAVTPADAPAHTDAGGREPRNGTTAPARLPWQIAIAALCLMLAAVLAWQKPWAPPTSLDRFWSPVISSPNPVTLCVGYTDLSSIANPSSVPQLGVALPDVTALSSVVGLLSVKGKRCIIKGGSSTTLADLRNGPAVLIGAYNNDWTMRLKGQMRFTFEGSGADRYIRDGQNASRTWSDPVVPVRELTQDYALISRVEDPTTGQVVVIAGGIHNYGTIAAGEFLGDPKYMDAVAARAPAGWWRKNVQLVIGTRVINGSSAPPSLLAAHFW
jgi:hypothetical protein